VQITVAMSPLATKILFGDIEHRYAPHNDVSANDGQHIRRWSLKIMI